MLAKTYKNLFINALNDIYPSLEIESFYKILLQHFKISQIDIALNPATELKADELKFMDEAIIQLKKEIPIQYIIGETEFFGLTFKVNKNVLIPRPETEELVQWIINDFKNNQQKKLTILDIGTGSGCIAISLAKNLPQAKVFAIDVSEEALKVARENAHLNNVSIEFLKINILEEQKLSEQFDIIVSNPPYVRLQEQHQMKKNVLDFEPEIALFVDDENPLIFYDKIASLAKNHLTKNGQLYFEINQYLGTEMIELLKKYDFKTIELKKDFYEVDRMIKA
ncbi:MAG: peptide chain release factor N(5)-glutamine methyltransferase, partial [Flavobacteriaceae bacterium]|nr:peptide chain release factor N(5)-glutamine methyltransferase [Flavobacteriaceae bacterium]